jgi:hypothetical protein
MLDDRQKAILEAGLMVLASEISWHGRLNHPSAITPDVRDVLGNDLPTPEEIDTLSERIAAIRPAPPALDEPLDAAEVRRQFEETTSVEGVVRIDFGEVVETCCQVGFEGLLDVLSYRLTGSCLLLDVDYEVVGVEDGTLLVKVDGDPAMIIADEGDDEG